MVAIVSAEKVLSRKNFDLSAIASAAKVSCKTSWK